MELVFGPDFLFRNAVLGGLLVALLCSVLGVYVVLRRLVLLGVALPQAGAAGIAAAFWLTGHSHSGGVGHAHVLIGSLSATFGSLGLLLSAQRSGRSPAEWSVGALFAVASAATVLFVALNPSGDLEVTNLLRGELLAIGDVDLIVLAVASFVALGLFFLFAREILLASFDPEFARTIGHEPGRADALLFLLLGGTIALGVMATGPLVVFGFLLLPALTALRVAPGLGSALAISAAIGALCSVGGFVFAYQADLPTGPTSVALAATVWLAVAAAGRVLKRTGRARALHAGAVLLALVAGSLLGGCATPGEEPAGGALIGRGSLPDLSDRGPIAVARLRNETGQALRIANPLVDLEQAAGRTRAPGWTVSDALQAQAILELARRGLAVRPFDEVRTALPRVPANPQSAARLAREAGLDGFVLMGTLRRYTVTGSGLLLVQLDLELVDTATGDPAWSGHARGPVPVKSALTAQEILIDAAPAIFAEAFGQD